MKTIRVEFDKSMFEVGEELRLFAMDCIIEMCSKLMDSNSDAKEIVVRAESGSIVISYVERHQERVETFKGVA